MMFMWSPLFNLFIHFVVILRCSLLKFLFSLKWFVYGLLVNFGVDVFIGLILKCEVEHECLKWEMIHVHNFLFFLERCSDWVESWIVEKCGLFLGNLHFNITYYSHYRIINELPFILFYLWQFKIKIEETAVIYGKSMNAETLFHSYHFGNTVQDCECSWSRINFNIIEYKLLWWFKQFWNISSK